MLTTTANNLQRASVVFHRSRRTTRASSPKSQAPSLLIVVAVVVTTLALAGCAITSPLSESHRPIALQAVPLQYDDNVQSHFRVSDAQWREIVSYFADDRDAAAERAAIARTVARLEQIAGEQTPIHNDGRKNYGSGAGQTDCTDESTNTTTFLRLMRERGLLKHHRVMNKALRGPLQFDIHWTAVVQDIHTNTKWVIDSWYNANGIEPIVQPLDDWMKKVVVPGYYAEVWGVGCEV